MRAIITGSHGFIGGNLHVRLLEDGHDVYCFDPKCGKDMFGRWLWPQSDVIYHLACVNQEAAIRMPQENINVNAYGAKFAAFKAKEMGAKLIYTSTASVYGRSERIPIPVDADIAPKSDYAIAKLAGEHFIVNSGCDYLILRLSNVYGPGQTTDNPYCGVIGKFIEQAEAGKPLTIVEPGTQTRDYTYIDDVIDVLLDKEIDHGIHNVSRGEEVEVLQLASMVSHFCEVEDRFEFIPDRGIDHIDRRKMVTHFRCPTALPEGLEKTVEWYRATSGEGSSDSIKSSGPRPLSGQTL